MGFLDKIREVAEEMERLAAAEEAARLEQVQRELLHQMERAGVQPPGPGDPAFPGQQVEARVPAGSGAPRRRARGPRPPGAPLPSRSVAEPPPDRSPVPPQALPPLSGFSLRASDLPRAMILKEILGPPPGLSEEPW